MLSMKWGKCGKRRINAMEHGASIIDEESFNEFTRLVEDDIKRLAERSRVYDSMVKQNTDVQPTNMTETLALAMLLNNLGNEEAINNTCDLIKELDLVEGYK